MPAFEWADDVGLQLDTLCKKVERLKRWKLNTEIDLRLCQDCVLSLPLPSVELERQAPPQPPGAQSLELGQSMQSKRCFVVRLKYTEFPEDTLMSAIIYSCLLCLSFPRVLCFPFL
jgi:hypothetical protein